MTTNTITNARMFEPSTSHAGIVHVSLSLLRDILMLPPEWHITALYIEPTLKQLLVHVEHPDLPELAEGNYPTNIHIFYETKPDDAGAVWMRRASTRWLGDEQKVSQDGKGQKESQP